MARAVAIASLVAVTMFGCVAPAVTEGGYHAKTTGALKVISSTLATAKLAMTLGISGRNALASPIRDPVAADAGRRDRRRRAGAGRLA